MISLFLCLSLLLYLITYACFFMAQSIAFLLLHLFFNCALLGEAASNALCMAPSMKQNAHDVNSDASRHHLDLRGLYFKALADSGLQTFHHIQVSFA